MLTILAMSDRRKRPGRLAECSDEKKKRDAGDFYQIQRCPTNDQHLAGGMLRISTKLNDVRRKKRFARELAAPAELSVLILVPEGARNIPSISQFLLSLAMSDERKGLSRNLAAASVVLTKRYPDSKRPRVRNVASI